VVHVPPERDDVEIADREIAALLALLRPSTLVLVGGRIPFVGALLPASALGVLNYVLPPSITFLKEKNGKKTEMLTYVTPSYPDT
jgi:hypothetical protein